MAQDELAALGETLRQARLQRDLTLREVEIALKIRAKFLEGIENGQPDPSLSEMQVRGFLRNYAMYLRLDPDGVLVAYEEAKHPKRRGFLALGGSKRPTTPLTPTPQRTATQPIPIIAPEDANEIHEKANRSPLRLLLTALLVVLLLGMMAGGTYIVLNEVSSTTETNDGLVDLPLETATTEGQVSNPGEFALPATLTPTQGVLLPTIAPNFVGADSLNINVTAIQRSWLRITVDGVVQFQGVLRPGTGIQLAGQDSIRLRTSNAGGLDVTINNQPLGILGAHSQEYDQTFTLDNQLPTPTPVPTLTPFMTPTGTGASGAVPISPSASATQVSIASTTAQQIIQPTNSNPNAPTPLPTLGAFSTETNTPTRTLTPTPITPTVTPTLTSTVTFTPTETLVMPDRVTRTPRP